MLPDWNCFEPSVTRQALCFVPQLAASSAGNGDVWVDSSIPFPGGGVCDKNRMKETTATPSPNALKDPRAPLSDIETAKQMQMQR